MTLKHIDFYDSPVMRELARQAIKNGTVTPKSVEEVVKTASANAPETYEPTGDLFVDMVRLADGLRSKGYIKEAESFEQKLIQYKLAAKEFADVLDRAHPDGDARVSESEFGAVETLESTHSKMKDVAKKSPTGKFAGKDFSALLDEAHPEGDVRIADGADGVVETLETAHKKYVELAKKAPTGKQAAAQSLLAAVAHILKVAQDAPIGERDFGNDNLTRQAEIINKINAIMDGLISEGAQLIDEAARVVGPTSASAFTHELVMSNPAALKLFARKSGKDAAAFASFVTRFKTVFGANQPSAQVIYDTISGMSAEQVAAYAKQIAPSALPAIQSLVSGQNPGEVKSTTDKVVDFVGDAATAVFAPGAFFAGDTQAKKGAAGALFNALSTEYNEYLGAEALQAATAALHAEMNTTLVQKLTPISAKVGKFEKLEPTAISNEKARSQVQAVIADLNAFVADKAANTLLTEISTAFGASGAAMQFVSGTVIPFFTAASEQIASLPISVSDQVPSIEQVRSVYSQFANARDLINQFIQAKGGDKSQAGIDNEPVRQQLDSILNAISTAMADRKTKPSYELLRSIPLPNIKTFEQLAQEAANYNKSIQSFVSTASADDNLIKQAQRAPMPGQSAAPAAKPAPGAAKPGATTQQQGVTHARRLQTISDDEKAAVKEMQELLAKIAEFVKDEGIKTELTTVGKNGATGADGAWLGYTSRGLKRAQALIDEWSRTSQKTVGQLEVQQMGGTQGAIAAAKKNSEVLRKYLAAAWNVNPQGQNQGQSPASQLPAAPAGAPEYLSSLTSFFDWLFPNNRTTTSVDGKEFEGVDATTFWMKLGELFNSYKVKDPGVARHIESMYKQLAAIINHYGLSPEGPKGNVITRDMVTPRAQSTQNGPGGAAHVHNERGRGGNSGQVGDGTEWPVGDGFDDSPPIRPQDGAIDFRSDYFVNLLSQFPNEAPRAIAFRSFSAMPAATLQSLFKGDQTRTLNYLKELDNAIVAAVNEWVDTTEPTLDQITRIQTLANRWRRVIGLKASQVGKPQFK